MNKRLLLWTLTIFYGCLASGQTCTEPGQNPGTAFPVCGVQLFTQKQVKICGDRKVPGPCSQDDVSDKNPYWYKFTCFESGSLGFIISPSQLTDDYDWQLFDITGHQPEDVYTDKSLFVACNWSGESGKTGATSAGTSLEVCGGLGKPLYSKMPQVIKGHNYLLLVSHFTDTQSGYIIDFRGGDANITDTKVPEFAHAWGSCKGNQIMIKLNKSMQCSSLAADGSDFILPSGLANIISASSPSCNGFDMDSIVLTLDRVLSPGGYVVELKKGSDDNTLLDACETEMAVGSRVNFSVYEDVSAAFFPEIKTGCKNDTLLLSHDGNGGSSIWNWNINGMTSLQQNATIILSTSGPKTITLAVSNEHCSDTAREEIDLPVKIDAAFNAPEIICVKDKAVFTDISSGNITEWKWDLGDGRTTNGQQPEPFNYSAANGEKTYRVSLIISSAAGCTDTAYANVLVVNNCSIAVPSAFTPNNDGKNDYLYPSNAFNTDNLIFRVFNRFGQKLFETRDWQRKWDGNVNGQPQSSGTYVWTLSYTLRTTGKNYTLKGTTVLIR